MKLVRLILPALLAATLVWSCSGPAPEPTETEYGDIDTSLSPLQSPYSSDETFTVVGEESRFTVTPVARYSLSARVVSKKAYSHDGWRSALAPVDLALSWGKLAETEYDKHISWSQHDRWYFYRWKQAVPFDVAFVARHSSNNHIIPANDNVARAVRSIEEEQAVTLEGFLVNVRGEYKGSSYWWNSSLSRTDGGNGSCEVFYVSKVRIGNEVYQ